MAATQFEVIETVNNNNAEESETKIKRRKNGLDLTNRKAYHL